MTTNESKRIGAHRDSPRLAAHAEEKLLAAAPDEAAAAASTATVEEDPIFTNSRRNNTPAAMKWGMAIMLALAVASAIAVVIGLKNHQPTPSVPDYAFATPGGNFVLKGRYSPQFASFAGSKAATDNSRQNSKSAQSTATAVSPDGHTRLVAIADPSTQVVYLFETDSSIIPENATLNEFARRAAAADGDITIVAYTDPTGSASHNLDLSQKRAKALGNYMTRHGVNPKKVKTSGRGSTDAFGSNDLDRRAELHF